MKIYCINLTNPSLSDTYNPFCNTSPTVAKDMLIENCNNYLVLRQNSAVNSENWANILGTRQTMEVTYQLQQKGLDTTQTGFGSARRVREFLYHPDEIKQLQTGNGIFLSRDEYFHSKLHVNKPF